MHEATPYHDLVLVSLVATDVRISIAGIALKDDDRYIFEETEIVYIGSKVVRLLETDSTGARAIKASRRTLTGGRRFT